MSRSMVWALALAASAGAIVVGCDDSDSSTTPAGNTAGAAGSAGAASDGTGTGPAAKLLCKSSGKNAFETYGSAFGAVNDAIIGNAAAELGKGGEPGFGPSLGPVAADEKRLNVLKTSLGNFLVFVYGGPNNYKGKSMWDAHSGLAISKAQYDYFLTNVVVKALADKGVPKDDIDSCFAPPLVDATFVAQFVTR